MTLTQEEKEQNLINLVLSEAKQGKVVLMTIEGLVSADLHSLVYNQPADGLLYDLNRELETVMTFIADPKWINDYAAGLVITELKTKTEELQTRLNTLRTLWHEAPSGFREGLQLYHPAEYTKWLAALGLDAK